MRTLVIHAPRDLRVEEHAVTEPGPGEVRVRIASGGICGSDLHYYQHGGFGVIKLKEPMILGHEIAGVVEKLGEAVTRVKLGDKVAVNPSRPCGQCVYCLKGQSNQCLDMYFYGSAMRFPHVQGGFREKLVVRDFQCEAVPAETPLEIAAFAEPFAVCLHAIKQAGDLMGRRVLVTGCGPIGALCIIAARLAGAIEIVATDVTDATLASARQSGADHTINMAQTPDGLAPFARNKGYFDVVIEASGNQRALVGALDVVRPGGTIVQVGLGGEATLPLNTIVAKEINLRGTFRFHEEFAWAASLLSSGRVNVAHLLTEVLPLADAVRGFELAGDRSRAMKVQLSFA